MSALLEHIITHEKPFQSKPRLISLYSDFLPLKTTNPDGYAANVSAWTGALARAGQSGLLPAREGNTLAIETGKALADALEYRDLGLGRPSALGKVVDELVTIKELIPLRGYLEAKRSVYAHQNAGWMPLQLQLPTPQSALNWALKQVGLIGEQSGEVPTGEYVRLKALEAASQAILDHVRDSPQTPSSLTFSLETFKATFSPVVLSASFKSPNDTSTPVLSRTDAALLLTHLSRDLHRASISTPSTTSTSNGTTSSSTTVIHFLPSSASPTSPPPPITQQDTTLASLLTLAHTLTLQIAALERRIAEQTLAARSAVSSSSSSTTAADATTRSRALTALRTRKTLSATLTQRQERLEQITRTIDAIDDAAGQAEMVTALEDGAKVLGELNRRVGGAERVEAVMDRLAEEREGVEEVGRVIAGEGVGGIDEGEVDEEMEALEREVQEGKRREELPDVPVGEPGKTREEEGKDKGKGEGEKALEEVEERLSLLSVDEREKSQETRTDTAVREGEA